MESSYYYYYDLFMFLLVSSLLVIPIVLNCMWLTRRRYLALQNPPPPQTLEVLAEIILPLFTIALSVCDIIFIIWLLLLQGVEIWREMETLLYHFANISVWQSLLYLPPQTMNALYIILPALILVWDARLILVGFGLL